MIDELPKKIEFHAVSEVWAIYYESCKSKFELIQRPGYEIVLIGSAQEIKNSKEKLVEWIRNKSKDYLIQRLAAISYQTQLYYNQVIIRNQKTIWGSCTSKKTISLNYKLLFLPKHLVDYIIIHELCHTKYLNHSDKFWKLVSLFDPNWKLSRQELRHSSNKFIPAFV